MSKEIVIRHGKIDIVIPFDSPKDLETKLKDYDETINVIKQNLKDFLDEKRVIRADLEGICDFQDNYVVLIKSPSEAVKKAVLTIYAYGPKGATLEEISFSTGISNPSSNLINAGTNKRYFRKISDKVYGLSDEGLTLVTQKILPELKGAQENAKS